MKHAARILILSALVAVIAITPLASQSELQFAKGVVFHDANRNGLRDASEEGIPDVRVSNGRTISKTDRDGGYSVPVDDDTIIFVIKPRGWMTAVDKNNVPRFHYIHKPKGSPAQKYKGVDPTGPLPESVDFPLYPHKEPDKFQAVFLGDTQPHSTQEVFYLAHDIVEELSGIDAAFGVTLGDVVGNNLPIYEDVAGAQGLVGVPWYNVKGNHDANYDGAPNHDHTYETWARVFGPPFYSYDYGPVHFVVLNNPYFGQTGGLVAKLDFRQMSWLRRDLALVPKDQLVVLMMHIPLQWMQDRAEVFGLLESRPNAFAIAGHTHTLYHAFCGEKQGWKGTKPFHVLVNGAACGAWWRGAPDEVGLPHSTGADGTPNGYSIITFDGNKYSIRYQAARRPADYQMTVFAPDEVASAETGKTKVTANVFAGSDRSKVEMRLGNGAWVTMVKAAVPDPNYARVKAFEDKITRPMPWRAVQAPGNSYHIWETTLPDNLPTGAHMIEVRTTDMFGQTYTGKRAVFVR